jgi:tRNA(Ile)-lysidine synthase
VTDVGPGPLPLGASRAQVLHAVAEGLAGIARGRRALVALSGGPDSTALAYLVAEARTDLDLVLVHVRHGLRDDALDRHVVAQHAAWLGLPLEVREVEVRRGGQGPAAAARRARYAALREVAAERGADAVLVGHTADDQAETLLLRLARGTGLDGLAGMSVHAGDLVRPLLRVRRADVHRFVLFEGLPSVADPGNEEVSSGRGRMRHEVLPALEAAAGDPAAALARLADHAASDAEALDAWAARVAATAAAVGPIRTIARAELDRVPVAVGRRALRHLVAGVGGAGPPSAAALARIVALRSGSAVDLPGGVRASGAAGWITLAPRELPRQDPTSLEVDGLTRWLPADLEVAWHGPTDGPAPEPRGQIALELTGAWAPPTVEVDASLLPPGAHPDRATLALPDGLGPLRLRHRRPGDRLALPAGGRRLKDVLIDTGVPRPVREVWPVVVADDDRLVWVPGVAADRDVLAAGRRRPAALLALRGLSATGDR